MKFTKTAALILSLSIVGAGIAACNNEPEPVSSDINIISTQQQGGTGATAPSGSIDADAEENNFYFVFSGVKLIPNSLLDDSKFNDDDYEFYETASCAGQGMSKEFTFKGGSFKVYTNPINGLDSISSIQIYDDTVTTPEGIYVGQTADEVKAVYGEPASESDTNIIYAKGSSELGFVIDGEGKVVNIIYNANI